MLRAAPSGAHGLHLSIQGLARGLRFETWPGEGAVFLAADAPARVRGGRGAWTDLAGAADARLAGLRIRAVTVAARPPAVRLVLGEMGDEGDAARLTFVMRREGGCVALEVPGEPVRWLPRQGGALPPAEAFAPPDEASNLPPAFLVDAGDPPRASRAPRVVLGDAPPDASRFDDPFDALAAWWPPAAACAALAGAKNACLRTLAAERRRVGRAAAAVRDDEAAAAGPDAMRRRADALLAAGAAARPRPGGGFVVPDPYADEPGAVLEVADPVGGLRPHELAQRMYARARREERGIEARRARAAALAARAATLDALAVRAEAADDAPSIAELQAAARAAGLAVGLAGTPAAATERAERGVADDPAGPARVYRSPSGFDVLVGRSAAQNDRLTFSVAGPEDLWLHVRSFPGAHVVVRLGGRRDAPPADVTYAARLAAAFSQASRGELVDVEVTRRKHVRRPRGAPAGTVTVGRASTVRVRCEAPPDP